MDDFAKNKYALKISPYKNFHSVTLEISKAFVLEIIFEVLLVLK